MVGHSYSTCTTSDVNPGRKVQTVKDLRKPIFHLQHADPRDLFRQVWPFDESTTVLLDDSPLKAVFQPWSQIVIPEYDKKEYQSTKAAVTRLNEDEEADRTGLDEILLGVIGILEELRMVENVPAWVRAGGLTPKLSVTGEQSDEGAPAAMALAIETELSLGDLPSHASFVHWYQAPDVLRHWIERGKQALLRKGIIIDIGIDMTNSTDSPALLPRFIPQYMSERDRSFEIDSSPAKPNQPSNSRRRHRWSPSRPASVEPTTEHERAIPSPSPRPPPVVPHQVRRPYTTAPAAADQEPPAQMLARAHIDQWRTFRAVDVSRYLADVADRPSPLNEQHRVALLQAVDILRSVAPDPSFDDTPLRSDLADMGFLPNMCETCTFVAGEMLNERQRVEKWKVASVLGLTADRQAPVGKKGKKSSKEKATDNKRSLEQLKAQAKAVVTIASKTKQPAVQENGLVQKAKASQAAMNLPKLNIVPWQLAPSASDQHAAQAQPGCAAPAGIVVYPSRAHHVPTAEHRISQRDQGKIDQIRSLQKNLADDNARAKTRRAKGETMLYYKGMLTTNANKRKNRDKTLADLMSRLPKPVRASLLRGDLTTMPDGSAQQAASTSVGLIAYDNLMSRPGSAAESWSVSGSPKKEKKRKVKQTTVSKPDGSHFEKSGSRTILQRAAKDHAKVVIHEKITRKGKEKEGAWHTGPKTRSMRAASPPGSVSLEWSDEGSDSNSPISDSSSIVYLSTTPRQNKTVTRSKASNCPSSTVARASLSEAPVAEPQNAKKADSSIGAMAIIPSSNLEPLTSPSPDASLLTPSVASETAVPLRFTEDRVSSSKRSLTARSSGAATTESNASIQAVRDATRRERSRQLAESVLIGEKRRLEAMSSQEEQDMADDEIAELLFDGMAGPMEGEEVEEERFSKRRRAEAVPA